jgi:hypothetical protein
MELMLGILVNVIVSFGAGVLIGYVIYRLSKFLGD